MNEHAVQLYQEDEELSDALARFAARGLGRGESVLILGTSSGWAALTTRLRALGVDVHGAVLRGQLRLFAARVILSSCMGHGVPERLAFNEVLGGLLALVRPRYPVLRVYSGLTDILWREGKPEAATAIERFWPGLQAAQPLSLLCGCPLDSLDGRSYEGTLQGICRLHTHLVPAGDSGAFDDAVNSAIREVLEPRLVGMLQHLSSRQPSATHMPAGQAVMLWLRQHMPRTAEKILARARARIPPA